MSNKCLICLAISPLGLNGVSATLTTEAILVLLIYSRILAPA